VKRYRVIGKKRIVAAVRGAIERSGAEVLSESRATEAPFEFEIRTPDGERLALVCYAFLANKYRQRGRPADEHRFQIKYGSDFDSYHEIFIDPKREQITLMFGAHLEKGIFVAVDPAMYNPTWFSRSVEFKTAHCEAARASGWIGWERERSQGRRKKPMPLANNQAEAVVAFTPEHFLRYVFFERLATGLDTGERLLLAERMGELGITRPTEHPLEAHFGLSAHQILDLIWGAFRLEAAVRGGVAEYHLGRYLETVPGMDDVRPLDEDGRPDFEVVYRRRPYLIECKNVLRRPTARGPKVDFQKTRASKRDPCTRYYEASAFDVLAACLHPVTQKWEFRFCCTSMLEAHPKCEGRLSQRVFVAGAIWDARVERLLDRGC